MAVRPESVEEWCLLMPNLLETNGWTVALTTAEAALMHSSCAWGGHLLKFELKDLAIQNAPEDPAQILVRPEVRALHQDNCPISGVEVGSSVGFVAPGEAIVEASIAQEATMKLCSVLFGDSRLKVMNRLNPPGSDSAPVPWHQKIRRNYPRTGDSACAFWKEDEGDERQHECLILTRPNSHGDRGLCSAYVVVRLCEDRFANWAREPWPPGKRRFYVIISLQSFKRGMPLLPAYKTEPSLTEIDAGTPYGLRRWLRYELSSSKFHLADYLKVFLRRLGVEIEAYETLDGQTLVPYQCAVRRDCWEPVRDLCLQAYALQKTAYRRANGGSGAPGMHDEVAAKFVSQDHSNLKDRLMKAVEPRLVVRKTFFDVEMPDSEDEHCRRAARRPKTIALARSTVMVM
ncbi:unnamed protein product [Durusdinium trenchii]|uniref:Histone acetyltransferase n=1 Tax=Durusdinium trenchii TaxID=1381693 RepID=A0ABP0H6M1_9DINO